MSTPAEIADQPREGELSASPHTVRAVHGKIRVRPRTSNGRTLVWFEEQGTRGGIRSVGLHLDDDRRRSLIVMLGGTLPAAPVSSSEDTPVSVPQYIGYPSEPVEGPETRRDAAVDAAISRGYGGRVTDVEMAGDTPARVWRKGNKAVWRGRVVTIYAVDPDGQSVAIEDHGAVLGGRSITELSEVPAGGEPA